jgi:multiple sugar transport system substrate-binding protein
MKKLSRRKFLRGAAFAAVGAAAAACQPKTVIVTEEKVVTQVVKETVKETVIVEGTPQVVEKEVTKVVEKQTVITATPPPAGPAKIVIFVGFGTGTDAGQIEIHDRIAEEYNSQGDGTITVEFLTVPHEEHQAKFSTMLAAAMPPDVCMPIGVAGVAENFEAWEDITPFIQADQYDLSVFSGLTVQLHNYPDKGQLGLPIGIFPTVIFYNEDLFDAAGVDYPPHEFGAAYADGDKWNYAKLVEIAKELTVDRSGNNANSPAFNWEETAQWGWNGWDWMSPKEWVGKWDGRTTGVSEDNKTAVMNSDGWLKAWEFNKDAIWTWHVRASDEQSGAFYDVAGDPMGSGLVGMWECHSWMSYAYGSWTEGFNWNVAAVPNAEDFPIVAPMHADTFTMVKAGNHKKQAWEVMKWMFQPEILRELAKNYGSIPAHNALAANWVAETNEDFPHVDFGVFLESAEYPDRPNHESWTPDWNRVWDAVDNAYALVSTGEDLNVPEVLDRLNAEVQGYLDEWWTVWG